MFRLAETSVKGGALVTLGIVVLDSGIDAMPMVLSMVGILAGIVWQLYKFTTR